MKDLVADKNTAPQGHKKIKPKKTFKQWAMSYDGQKYLTTILFLLIPVVLLVAFTFIPAFNMFVYSFQNRKQLGTPTWCGFDNYFTLFTNKDYFVVFLNSLYYFVGSFIQLSIALLIASILCTKIRGKGFFKGVLFFPYLMNGVAVSLIFRQFFQKGSPPVSSEGILNSLIVLFGGSSVNWLATPFIANCCLVFASIWRYIGFDIVMFIGAINSISAEIYEAAELDGANSWQRFKYIVFPSIKPIILLQMILAVKGSISVFEIPYIITGGKSATSTFVITTIETAFKYDKIGLASAMAVVLLFIIVVVTIIQKAFFKEDK